jgi:hypothetical protein
MSSEDLQPTEIQEFRVEATPATVPAGDRLRLKAFMTTSLRLDLSGHTVRLLDEDELRGELVLESLGAGIYESAELELDAPVVPGEHQWDARLEVEADSGKPSLKLATPVVYTVAAHRIVVSAFKIPTAIPLGESFEVVIGAKCTSGCTLAGQRIIMHSGEDSKPVTITLGNDLWPDTEALYFSVAQLRAGETEGQVPWEVQLEPEGLPVPHEAEPVSFMARYVPAPEHELRVEVFDSERQTPVKGASVVVHPFRAITDDEGVALIKVPTGEHRLFVSGFQYYPFRSAIRVDGDAAIRADLLWEAEEEIYDQHY